MTIKSGYSSFGRELNVVYEQEEIASLKIDIKADNSNLLDVIMEICQQVEVGFNLILEEDASLTLSFYTGRDKTKEVLISLDMDTASDMTYYKDTANTGNVFYVLGQSFKEGEKHVFEFFITGDEQGTERKEVFVDLSDMTRKRPDGSEMPLDEYKDALWAKLMTNVDGVLGEEVIESTIPGTYQNSYQVEYEIGDTIIQEFKALSVYMVSKITAVSQSWDEDGYELTLTCENKGVPNKEGGALRNG